MKTKECCKCHNELGLDQFHTNVTRKDGYSGVCKECEKQYKKKYYAADPSKFQARVRQRRAELREWYHQHKSQLICTRCPENHPACMQFHHLDRTKKEFSISKMVQQGFSITRIEAEMQKCIILCANCHSKEHYNDE